MWAGVVREAQKIQRQTMQVQAVLIAMEVSRLFRTR